MNTVTITRVHEWDMAHRLGDGYKSKCRHLHGHRYRAHITIVAPTLDEFGMVLDFAAVKEVCGGWIDGFLDHATLVSEADQSLHKLLASEDQRFMCVPFNTTVENIVQWLAERLQVMLNIYALAEKKPQLKVTHLRVYETPNGWADWSCQS